MKYANAKQNTRVQASTKFEYYLEDLDCTYCTNYRRRGGHGCGRSKCEFQGLRDECVANKRIKRKRGWDKCTEE